MPRMLYCFPTAMSFGAWRVATCGSDWGAPSFASAALMAGESEIVGAAVVVFTTALLQFSRAFSSL